MKFRRLALLSAFGIVSLYGLLVLSLLGFVGGADFWGTLWSSDTLSAVRLSLLAATASAILAMLVALPAAWALSRFRFPGSSWVDMFLEFPMIVSPAALGAMILMFFRTTPGEWVQGLGVDVVFAFSGIVLAQFLTTVGIAVRLIKAVLDEIPVRYENVARSLGASSFQSFRSVVLPLSARGLLASGILVWAKALGEFGATITVAGSLPGKTETLPIAIFLELGKANLEGASVLILILLFFGVSVLALTRLLVRRRNLA
ncbi:MAG TPA: ABC transporter permease subunit [Planctomycetes bacterium]|nr:ABC transporter permease subunit [Planctomycetota bacterium]